MTNAFRQIVDYLFGYDFFISYSHGDGKNYPRILAQMLESAGYSVFLDSVEYVAGVDLKLATRRRIRMSKKLVVIARPNALASDWVRREVEVCLDVKGTPIVVDIQRTIEAAADETAIKQLLRDKLYINEAVADIDGTPSQSTLDELIRSFGATRQETLRLRFVSYAAVLFLLVAMAAAWQSWLAVRRGEIAVAERLHAEDTTRTAVAESVMREDPTQAALVLTEIREPGLRAISLMNEALTQPLAEREFRGHTGALVNAHWNESGDKVLTGSFDCTARVWSVGGTILPIEMHHGSGLRDVAWSEGERVSTASLDRSSRLWLPPDFTEVAKVRSKRGFEGTYIAPSGDRILSINSLEFLLWRDDSETLIRTKFGRTWPRGDSFSPDGRKVLTFNKEGEIQIWNTEDGTAWRNSQGQAVVLDACDTVEQTICDRSVFDIRSAVFSPDGSRVAAATSNSLAIVWSLEQRAGEQKPIKLGHDGEVLLEVAFTPDGRELITLVRTGTLRKWNLQDPLSPIVFPGIDGAPIRVGAGSAFSIAPNAAQLAVGSAQGDLRLVALGSIANPQLLKGHRDAISSVEYNKGGSHILTGSEDFTSRIWHTLGQGVMQHEGAVNDAIFSPDSELVATASEDGSVGIWQGLTSELITRLQHDSPVNDVEFDHVGQLIVSAATDGMIRVWATKNSSRPLRVLDNDAPVLTVAFSPDGSQIVSTDLEGRVRVWDASAGKLIKELGRHPMHTEKEIVASAKFGPTGNDILSSSNNDEYARYWTPRVFGDWKLGADGVPLPHGSGVWSSSFGPDGELITVTSYNSDTHLWAKGGERTCPIGNCNPFSGSGKARSAAMSPDGARIVTGFGDGTVWTFDPTRQQDPLRQLGHEKRVHHVAISQDSQSVVSASADSTAKVWPINGTREPIVLRGHQGEVVSAAFSADGKRVLTASADGSARIWWLDSQELQRRLSAATSMCLTTSFRQSRFSEERDYARAAYEACELAEERCPGLGPYLEASRFKSLLEERDPGQLNRILKGVSLEDVYTRATECKVLSAAQPARPEPKALQGLVPCPTLTDM